MWRDYTRLAWFYNPSLAIFLPQRIRNAESIEDEVTRLVCSDPIAVSHIPEALKYLVTTKTLLAESYEVSVDQITFNFGEKIRTYKKRYKLWINCTIY